MSSFDYILYIDHIIYYYYLEIKESCKIGKALFKPSPIIQYSVVKDLNLLTLLQAASSQLHKNIFVFCNILKLDRTTNNGYNVVFFTKKLPIFIRSRFGLCHINLLTSKAVNAFWAVCSVLGILRYLIENHAEMYPGYLWCYHNKLFWWLLQKPVSYQKDSKTNLV